MELDVVAKNEKDKPGKRINKTWLQISCFTFRLTTPNG